MPCKTGLHLQSIKASTGFLMTQYQVVDKKVRQLVANDVFNSTCPQNRAWPTPFSSLATMPSPATRPPVPFQDGTCHRQLSDFCRRDLIPHVAAVSSFRNAHSPRPYLSQRIHATPEQETHSSDNCSRRRRRRRRRAPSRIAHWPAAAEQTCRHSRSNSSGAVVVSGADGRVEVRAAGGNARLTLSASGTVAEVEYAVALPPGPGAAEGRVAAANRSSRVDGGEGSAARSGGRVWVTRRFLVVGPPFDDVPPEFSHALSVAVRESQSAAAAALETGRSSSSSGGRGFSLRRVGPGAAAAGGTVSRKGGGGGLVAVELPRPEERPDHAR